MADEFQIVKYKMEDVEIHDPISAPVRQVNFYEENQNNYVLTRPLSSVAIRFVSSGQVVKDEINIGGMKKNDVDRKIVEKKPVYDHNFQIEIHYAWMWSKKRQVTMFNQFRDSIKVVIACANTMNKKLIRETSVAVITHSSEPQKYDVYMITAEGVQIERNVLVGILSKTTLRE